MLIVTQSATDVPPGDDWLTPWEVQFAASRQVPKRREEWRLGRWTAKLAVRDWLGAGPVSEIEIRPRPDGAPEAVVRGGLCPCAISISHSHGRAICAVGPSGSSPGCDIELVEEREPSFVADYFTGAEFAYIASLPEAVRALATTLVWSAKESALKAIGEGLRLDTREVEVVTDGLRLAGAGAAWRRLDVVRWTPRTTFPGWWRYEAPFVLVVAAPSALLDEPTYHSTHNGGCERPA